MFKKKKSLGISLDDDHVEAAEQGADEQAEPAQSARTSASEILGNLRNKLSQPAGEKKPSPLLTMAQSAIARLKRRESRDEALAEAIGVDDEAETQNKLSIREIIQRVQKKRLGRIYFASSVADISTLPKRATVMLYGDSTTGTTEIIPTPRSYVQQPDRPTTNLLGYFASRGLEFDDDPPKSFQVYIRDDLLAALEKKKARIYFALDQFLKFGQSQYKLDRVMLVTGGFAGSSFEETYVEVWHFRHGRLLSFSPRRISARNEESFIEDVQSLISTERMHRSGKDGFDAVYLYKDLDPERVLEKTVDYIDFGVFAAPRAFEIKSLQKKPLITLGMLIPLGIVAGTAAAVSGTSYLSYEKYEDNNKLYRLELKAFDGDPRLSAANIDRYEAYRSLFESGIAEHTAATKMSAIIEAVASLDNGAFLEDLTIFEERTEGYDFLFVINVPLKSDVSGYDTGRPIVGTLASRLGATVESREWKDITTKFEDREFRVRSFTMQGIFNDEKSDDE